ncbi:phage prohead protein [Archaeoglobales archaeon]|nr:MAG: phage prohead protein [Archaeoglobales archaeon]
MPKQLVVKALEIRDDEKNVYVEGYASAAVEDLEGEIISEEALQKVAKELTKEPYNKVFLDHAPMKFNANFEEKLPIGKIVEAATREVEGKLKLWMKLIMNKAHPYFEVVYKSIKEGFLNAFSIGFQVLQRKGRVITDLKILEVSLVGIPANPEAIVEEVYEKMLDGLEVKGVVPSHPWNYSKDEQSGWTKPNLSDFTDKSWDELTDAEKRSIAGHFAWAAKMPPENYTDLKLPHHDPKTHKVVWRGVVAAMAALLGARGGVDIPAEDKQKVYNHLARHYRDDFGREPPKLKELEEFFAELKEIEDVDGKNDQSHLKSLISQQQNMEEFEKKIKELEATNSELSEKISELEAKVAELEAENTKLKEDNERLSNQVKQYVEREKAELIEKIKALTDEANEELKKKDVAELKEFYLTLLETKVIKTKSLPPKVKVVGEEGGEGEVDFKGVF